MISLYPKSHPLEHQFLLNLPLHVILTLCILYSTVPNYKVLIKLFFSKLINFSKVRKLLLLTKIISMMDLYSSVYLKVLKYYERVEHQFPIKITRVRIKFSNFKR